MLIAFAIIARSASLGESPTWDEPTGLVAALIQSRDLDFRFDAENPILFKYIAATGIRHADFNVEFHVLDDADLATIRGRQDKIAFQTLYRTAGIDSGRLINAARRNMIGLGVILGVVIAWWTWQLGGPMAALVAVALFSLDPNFLAHGPLVKNDVPIVLAMVSFMATIWLLGRRVSIARWALVAALSGAALTTKFSGVLTIPILIIALFVRAAMGHPWPIFKWNVERRASRFAVAAILCIATLLASYGLIWACYGFRFSAGPRGTAPNMREVMGIVAAQESILARGVPRERTDAQIAQWVKGWHPSLLARLIPWAVRHRVLPEAWLCGFILTYANALYRDAFLCGMYGPLGWWYYFPLAILFKTPLATLCGILAAAWLSWRQRDRRDAAHPDGWTRFAVALAPALYFLVAMLGHLDLGLRHVLVIYPFLYIFAGVVAASTCRRWPRRAGGTIAALMTGLAVETAMAFPSYISFFNAACLGPRGGVSLLSDSNLDWGQDLPALAEWQQQHPQKQIYLNYYSTADPAYYGFKYFKTDFESTLPDLSSGWPDNAVFAIDATTLQGTYLQDRLRQQMKLSWGQRQPIAVVGGSIYIFDVPRSSGRQ